MRYRPPERKVKKTVDRKAFVKRWFFRFLLILILMTGLAFGLRALSYSKGLNITEIQVEGTAYADPEAIRISVDKYLEDPILGFFSRRNIFLVSRYNLEEYVKEDFRGLKFVKADIKDKIIHLNILEYKPKYLWCGDTPPLIWDEIVTCFYASEDGFVFSKAPFFSGDAYLKFYGPLGDGFSIIPVGSRISSLTEFLSLVAFKDEISNIGLLPEAVALSGIDTVTILLWRGEDRAVGQVSPKIIFDKDQDFSTLTRHLKAAIEEETLRGLLDTQYNKLLYIDLRTDSKVFYKFLK